MNIKIGCLSKPGRSITEENNFRGALTRYFLYNYILPKGRILCLGRKRRTYLHPRLGCYYSSALPQWLRWCRNPPHAVWPRQTQSKGRLLKPQPKKCTWTCFIAVLQIAQAVAVAELTGTGQQRSSPCMGAEHPSSCLAQMCRGFHLPALYSFGKQVQHISTFMFNPHQCPTAIICMIMSVIFN